MLFTEAMEDKILAQNNYFFTFLFRGQVEGGQVERERENFKHAPCWAQTQGRARFHNTKIMTWAKIKSQRLNQLQATQAPLI